MPLQTRRQAATSSPGGTSDDPTSQQVDDRIQGEVEETPNKQQRRSAQHAQHIKSSPPSSSHHHHPQHPNDSPEYDSRERVERVGPPSSASRHSGGWHERGGPSGAGRPYPPAGGGQEQLYSSPPFKGERYPPHPQSQQREAVHQHADMDERTARDYDQLDLENEDIGIEDPLFPLSSFAESPPRRSPEPVDPSSERKRSASSSHPRRSPPPQPYSYSYSQYNRRTPSRSAGGGPPPHEYPHSTPSSQGRIPSMYSSQYGYQGGTPAGYGPPRSSPSRGGGGYYHGQSSYYKYHPEQQHWEGTPYRDYPPGTPYYDREEDIIPPPPQSAAKRPKDEPMSPGRSGAPTRDETPEKEKQPARSPFRSPPQSLSKQRFRRSPMNPSPYIGGYGSWEMNTPSGTLAQEAFSPMGATFAGFDENTPFQLGEGSLSERLGITRSGSQDSGETPMGRRLRPKATPRSPIAGLLNDLSPFGGAIIRGTPASTHHGYDEHAPGSRDPSSARSKGSAVLSVGRTTRLPRTPVESVAKPRKLWPGEHPTSSASTPAGHVRMEIGGSSSRKSFEGINSMMHSRATPRGTPHHPGDPSHHTKRETPHHGPREMPRHHPGRETPSHHIDRYPGSGPPPPPHHHYAPPMHYRTDMTTPIKPVGLHGHPHQQRPTPTSGHHPRAFPPGPPGSASKPSYSPVPPKMEYPGSTQKPPVFRGPPRPNSETPRQMPTVTGKENTSGKKKSPGKRSPCNCKRSKCLKLYCECFAAERFCDGCNCSDCGNTPAGGLAREKAIKDTRAKNPNAFKPRFGAKATQGRNNGHNMGCRCKKSECLKKYCECFQAGVICGGKCKCVDCLNYAGSQALIDKRRKIKDQRGADFAMRVADEAWKGRVPHGGKKPPPSTAPAASAAPGRRPPSPGRLHPPPPPHHMTRPSNRGPPPSGPHPYYMPPPQHYMHHHPPGHSPPGMMGIPITPAGYPYPPHMPPVDAPPPGIYHPPPPVPRSAPRKAPQARKSKAVTPVAPTPKTPAVRVKFDPAASRKKRGVSHDGKEPTRPYFGAEAPEQPKTTALAIFSFLTNDDLFNAGLVCKSWSQLATDGELWKFEK